MGDIIFYNKINRIEKAKEFYMKMLKLNRVLVETNPTKYNLDLASSLVMGVDLLNQPIENLDEAEKILKIFKDSPEAKYWLGAIEKLRRLSEKKEPQ